MYLSVFGVIKERCFFRKGVDKNVLEISQGKRGAKCLLSLMSLGHVSKYLNVKYVSFNHNFSAQSKHKADG